MDTQRTVAPTARSSGALTAAIGLAAAIVGLLFAFDSAVLALVVADMVTKPFS
ncbi:MAG: hypothetical protein IRZ20_02835 [Thermoleophilia bacterium]|nr:hypothetical protein [Thermoleophilia bacterium]